MKAAFQDILQRPTGHFLLKVYRKGLLVGQMDEKNLIVDNSKDIHARLLGGSTSNRIVTQIAFGTSGSAPAGGNTTITGAFKKAVDSVTYGSGSVTFAFSLAGSEDNPQAIMEFGLLTANDTLYARKVRSSALNKDTDVSLSGSWTITF